jgi:predicted nuclease with TOPRIM domain
MKKIGMSLLAVALCTIAFAKVSRAADEKVTGYVIDEKCSTMPKMMGNVECAKKCADGGSKLVIATDKGGKVYAVDNQDALKGHEGHHVTVSGAVTGMSIHVTDVAMMPAK